MVDLQGISNLIDNANYDELHQLNKFFSDLSWRCFDIYSKIDSDNKIALHQPLYHDVLSKLQSRDLANQELAERSAKANPLAAKLAAQQEVNDLSRHQTDKFFSRV